MMKKRICALALSVSVLFGGCAAAEQLLPSNDVFSPGLIRLSEQMAQQPAVTAEAEFSVTDAYYARDLSVMSSMLEGTTFRYEDCGEGEKLTIVRGEEVLGEYVLSGDVLSLGDQQITLGCLTGEVSPEIVRITDAVQSLQDNPVLEKVQLSVVADWLESLAAGQELAFGFRVADPIVLKRTMNEDGTRLARVDVEAGSIVRGEECPYVISGYMRQPLGRAPKDTFEIVFTQDERNFMELSYSAQRENAVATKNKKGEATVRTQLKAAGKIAGSSISSRLTVNMTNAWTADGEALNERVTLSATLTHNDNTPDRDKLRLNDVQLKLRQVIRMTTHDAGDENIGFTDEISVEAIMDEKTFLNAQANVRMAVGKEKSEQTVDVQTAGENVQAEEAMSEAVRDLAKKIYPHLSEKAKKKTVEGM